MTEPNDDRTIGQKLAARQYGGLWDENLTPDDWQVAMARSDARYLGLDPDMTVAELRRRLEIAERALMWHDAIDEGDYGYDEITSIVEGD